MKKRILIAPLNWGLGHATRCIPIIKALQTAGFEPIIASDGVALSLLEKEFPNVPCVTLPAYDVTYAKKGKYFKLKLLKDSPKLLKAIHNEKKAVKTIIEMYGISGIISDNRLGVFNKNVPCVFMTHQLNVLSGLTTYLSTKLHENYIKRFDCCWVPDTAGAVNLSGKLGHSRHSTLKVKYIGPISRFTKKNESKTIELLVMLSGPEPQRTMLEDKLFKELKHYKGRIVFVRGVLEKNIMCSNDGNMTVYNFMTSDILETTLNKSKIVLSRSGYTTIMDLAKLEKSAFFIPTPGQTEQEYLAKRLNNKGFIPSCHQDDFKLEMLHKVADYNGLKPFNTSVDYNQLFSLF